MSDRQKFLRTITNPSLAYFLLIFGLIGLFIEFTHPGVRAFPASWAAYRCCWRSWPSRSCPSIMSACF